MIMNTGLMPDQRGRRKNIILEENEIKYSPRYMEHTI